MPDRSPKTLVIPGQGKRPTFEEVARVVLTGARCDLSVCVICLSPDTLVRWMAWLETLPGSVTLLDALNTNRATLKDWQTFLQNQTFDLTVLAGVEAELQARRLSVGYVKALVEAAPAGLVMVA